MDSSGESRNRQKETYTLQFKYFDKIYRSSPWLGGNGRMGTWVYHTVNSESDVCVPTRRMCGGRPRALFWIKGDLERQAAKQPYWHPNGRIIIYYSFLIRTLAQLQRLQFVARSGLNLYQLMSCHVTRTHTEHPRCTLLFSALVREWRLAHSVSLRSCDARCCRAGCCHVGSLS